MKEEPHSPDTTKGWLERLGDALLREPRDREQLVTLLRDAQDRQLLDADALSMIEGVLQVQEMQVRDIMIPRSQMIVIEEDQSLEQLLPLVIESAHSRFPVIGETLDEVAGILLAKDLLKYALQGKAPPLNLRDIIRAPIFVPESKRLDPLLKEFRKSHNHMAVVVDEFGGVSGLVTIEDVLEQIVGEIEDEFDIEQEDFIKKHSEVEYIVKALTPIEDFNEYFHTNLESQEYDTISGLVSHAFGHLPKRGEQIKIGKYEFEVLQADSRRIGLLQLKIVTPDVATSQE